MPKLFMIFFLFANICLAQNKEELEAKRKALKAQIEQTNHILQQTMQDHAIGMSQLLAIQQQIGESENLIKTLDQELLASSSESGKSSENISILSKELQAYKNEYAEMVYATSKSNQRLSKLSFIFAAQSFNQLVARLEYFRQYSESRKKHIQKILELKEKLDSHKQKVERNQKNNLYLLQNQQFERERLSKLKAKQFEMIANLQKKQQTLLNDLHAQRTEIANLDQLIAQTLKAVAQNPVFVENSKDILFENKKGKMNLPVNQGFITQKFGKQAHPILENIFVDNLGITIRTAENESVISIFEGKIVTILPQESNTFLLILQHGDYFSIYTPVRNVQVQVEQDVKAGEILGKVCSNEDRIAEIQLQIWYKNPKANAPEKINPEEWLLK